MAAGNVNTPAALWDRDRTLITGEWPEALVVLDLRFWADPIACHARPRPPQRDLAATWGWSKGRAARFIQAWDLDQNGGAPVGRQRGTTGASAGRQRGNPPPADADNAPATGRQRGTDGARMGQKRGTGEAPHRETRARSSLVSRLSSRTPPPYPPPGGRGDGAAPPDQLVEACHELLVALQPAPELLGLIRRRDDATAKGVRQALRERGRLPAGTRRHVVADALVVASRRDLTPPAPEPTLPFDEEPEPPPPAEAAAARWREVRPLLVEELGHSDVAVWLDRCVPTHLDDHRIQVWCPNEYYVQWIEEHHLDVMERVFGLEIQLVSPERARRVS